MRAYAFRRVLNKDVIWNVKIKVKRAFLFTLSSIENFVVKSHKRSFHSVLSNVTVKKNYIVKVLLKTSILSSFTKRRITSYSQVRLDARSFLFF